MKTTHKQKILGALALSAVLPMAAQAGTIVLNPLDSWSPAILPGTTSAPSNLTSSTLSVSGVDVTLSATGGGLEYINFGPTSFGVGISTDTSFIADAEINPGETLTFTFSESVSLVSYDAHLWNNGGKPQYTIGGDTFIDTVSGQVANDPVTLTSQTSQTFTSITFGASTANGGFLNLTFETVPEPSSTALLGLGGLALILRRRK